MTRLPLYALPALALASLLPTTAQAQRTGLEDLIGARAGQAEGELGRRGYRWIRSEQGDDRSYSYWWNSARGQCVTIATMDGRYNAITATLPPDCRQMAMRPPQPSFPPPTQRPGYGYDPDPLYVGGAAVQLGLVCFGDGTRPGVATRPEWTWNKRKGHYEDRYRSEISTEVFDTSLTLQIWPGGGRIRLPHKLRPPINSGGSDGWWELRDTRLGADQIRASYRLNSLNRPQLTVDRRSGRIRIKGLGDYGFNGTCDQVGDGRRRF